MPGIDELILLYILTKEAAGTDLRLCCFFNSRFLLSCVRKQSYLTSALNSNRKHTLIFSGSSGNTARKNLAALTDELLQRLDVFIVNVLNFVNSKVANFTALVTASAASGETTLCPLFAAAVFFFSRHLRFQSFLIRMAILKNVHCVIPQYSLF